MVAKSKSSVIDQEEQSRISEFLQDMQELGIGEPSSKPLTKQPLAEQNGLQTTPKDVNTKGDEVGSGENMSPLEKRLMSEWVPLGLNFGIPLFDEEANKVVCKKVKRYSVCVCVCVLLLLLLLLLLLCRCRCIHACKSSPDKGIVGHVSH